MYETVKRWIVKVWDEKAPGDVWRTVGVFDSRDEARAEVDKQREAGRVVDVCVRRVRRRVTP